MEHKFTDKLEQELQLSLPQDYKHFLKGGIIKVGDKNFLIGETCHNVCYENNNCNNETVDFATLNTFYGDTVDEIDNLLINNNLAFYKRIPSDFITIACTLGDNQICLGAKGAHTGKIYLWEMEFEADENTPQPYYDNMTLITNTFQDFLDGLFLDI